MKIVIALAFIVIVGALVSAGVLMLRRGRDADAADPAKAGRMARALAIRVGVSVALFAFILLAWLLGWIEPTGVPVGR